MEWLNEVMGEIKQLLLDNTDVESLENTSVYDFSGIYSTVRFGDINAISILPSRYSDTPIFGIDGSNKLLLSTQEFALSYVRVVAYNHSEREVISSSMLSFCYLKDDVYILKHYLIKGVDLFNDFVRQYNPNSPEYSYQGTRAKPEHISALLRRYAEWNMVKYINEKYDNVIILKDGSLHSNVRDETALIGEVLSTLKDSNALLCFVKENMLLSSLGRNVLYDVSRYIREKYDHKTWVFGPLAKGMKEIHPAEIYAVKLHPQGRVYRVDVPLSSSVSSEIYGTLMHQCRDAMFLGYPYALVKADAESSIKDYEVENLRSKILSESSIRDYVSSFEDMHEILVKVR